jgi:hypothetical protein
MDPSASCQTKNQLTPIKAVGQTSKAQKARKCALPSGVTLDVLTMSFFKSQTPSVIIQKRLVKYCPRIIEFSFSVTDRWI